MLGSSTLAIFHLFGSIKSSEPIQLDKLLLVTKKTYSSRGLTRKISSEEEQQHHVNDP